MSCKAQLANNFLLEIVPDHHFVGRPFRAVSAAYQGHYIRFVDHLGDGYTSIEISLQVLHDLGIARAHRVYPEAILRSHHEAIVLLIKADRAARLAG